jgi:hypothetical protein
MTADRNLGGNYWERKLGDSRLAGGAVAVAAMSVSFALRTTTRDYKKEPVRSADSNREVEEKNRKE